MLGSDISGAKINYTPFLTTWAEIQYVRGSDVLTGGQIVTQSFMTVRMGFRQGVASNMQVQTANGKYVIQSIENELEMNAVLILNCVAIAGPQ